MAFLVLSRRRFKTFGQTQVGNHQADLEALRNEVSARVGEFREELREAFESPYRGSSSPFSRPCGFRTPTVASSMWCWAIPPRAVVGCSLLRSISVVGERLNWTGSQPRLACWRCSLALHDQVAPQVGRAVSGNLGAVVEPCEPFAPVDSSAPPTPALVAEPPVSGLSASEPLWGASKTQAEQ